MAITSGITRYDWKTPIISWGATSINGGGLTVRDNVSSARTHGQTSKSWIKDTDWKVKVSKKQDASHAYSRTHWEYLLPHYSSGVGTANYGTRPDAGLYTFRDYDLANSSAAAAVRSDPTLKDQALARFKRELSGALGNAKLAIPVVELRELRSTISQSAKLSQELLENIVKIRKTKGRAAIKYIQDAWLTYSFGVAPMIADTMAALDAVKAFQERPSRLHRIRKSASARTHSGSTTTSLAYYGFGWSTQTDVTQFLQYTYTGAVDFKFTSSNDYSLRSHLGLFDNWRTVPSLLWELMPFSWVFDYFTTVGAFLDDTFELPPGSLKYLNESTLYTGHAVITRKLVPWTATSTGWFNQSIRSSSSVPGHARYVSFERKVLTALPHRSLRIKTVDEVGRNAVNKLLNLSAILKPRK